MTTSATTESSNQVLTWSSVRCLFAERASISEVSSGRLLVRLSFEQSMKGGEPAYDVEKLVSFLGHPPQQNDGDALVWEGVSALDLLGALVERDAREERAQSGAERRLKEAYEGWGRRMAWIGADGALPGEIGVQRLSPDAVLPGKERVSDSGYDLTLIAVRKTLGNVVLYGTGLRVEPPHGWYLDVVPRSSIIKLGYVLANSVGVIDRSYRGELMVPLIKLDESAKDLALPARVAQMIPRPIVHFPIRELSALSDTHRGVGGFGSSGA